LGSEASVGDAVLGALAAFTTGSVTRLAGADRYATAVALSTATYPSATTVYLADGLAFPDALAAAAAGGPLLLTPPGFLPAEVAAEIGRLGANHVIVLGGPTSVSDAVAYATVGQRPPSFALPAGVTPAPAAARADNTENELRTDGCMALDAQTVPSRCVYGDPHGTFTVALVGDSHAADWFPPLEAIAGARGWRLVTYLKVRCPFVDMRVDSVNGGAEYTACEAWDRAVVADLGATKPDLTLISMSRQALLPTLPAERTISAEAAAESRLVARLPGRVGLVVDTPYDGVDIPLCLLAHRTDIRACDIPYAVATSDALGLREAAVAATTGAGLLDLGSDVCPGDPCLPLAGKVLIFRDISHLTATFSRTLTDRLAALIDVVLTAP
ncbi:MAG: SGNH hydrolase domain-containing protein, partial [Candidatus Limnocylindrales bacterium]